MIATEQPSLIDSPFPRLVIIRADHLNNDVIVVVGAEPVILAPGQKCELVFAPDLQVYAASGEQHYSAEFYK